MSASQGLLLPFDGVRPAWHKTWSGEQQHRQHLQDRKPGNVSERIMCPPHSGSTESEMLGWGPKICVFKKLLCIDNIGSILWGLIDSRQQEMDGSGMSLRCLFLPNALPARTSRDDGFL